MTHPTDPGASPRAAEPSIDERTNAMLAHVLSLFTGFLGPSVIYFAKRRESRFVAFHALQATVWHLALFVAMFGSIAILFLSLVTGVLGPPRVPSPGVHASGPVPFLAFGIVWVLAILGWFVSMGYAVYLAMQASAGRWARYPVVGRLIARSYES